MTKPVSGGVSPSRRPPVVVGPTAGEEAGPATAAAGRRRRPGEAAALASAAATAPEAAVARRVSTARRPRGVGAGDDARGGGEDGGASPNARGGVTVRLPAGATAAPRPTGGQKLQLRGRWRSGGRTHTARRTGRAAGTAPAAGWRWPPLPTADVVTNAMSRGSVRRVRVDEEKTCGEGCAHTRDEKAQATADGAGSWARA